jgi:hypothetical protein
MERSPARSCLGTQTHRDGRTYKGSAPPERGLVRHRIIPTCFHHCRAADRLREYYGFELRELQQEIRLQLQHFLDELDRTPV